MDANKFLIMMEEFIEHNKSLKTISGLNTVDELVQFIGNIKDSYLPMVEKVQKYAEELSK